VGEAAEAVRDALGLPDTRGEPEPDDADALTEVPGAEPLGVPPPFVSSRCMSRAAADTPAPAIAATSSAATSTPRVERRVSTVDDGDGDGDGAGAGAGGRGTSRWVGV